MPRYVEKPLDAKVHVIDANGDPVTGASVSVKVLDPSGSDWDGTWAATYLSDGIYYTQITPDEAGDWTFIFSCSNPKFTKAIVYRVCYPTSYAAPLNGMNQVFPVDTSWQILFQPYNEDWIQRKIYMVTIMQSNDETAAKDIEIILNLDGVRSINMSATLDSGVLYYIMLDIADEDNYTYTINTQKTMFLKVGGRDNNGDQWSSMPLECRNYDVQVRVTGAVGTNQMIQGHISTTQDYSPNQSYIGD
jgi:hypothetical protein